ncbi:5-methylcytosine restriction system specificity protein McrC [Draconibacterium orientale]|uniref:5-methylcytosine restriction system specificity protein McrC n=1 Tax=Draconibacterium orientale TaxID=1168034 RepID=UPI002A0A632B|nr:hypothetical protein [Draconibacterium orientale]
MQDWLYNILKNNTLVDNQIYNVTDGLFTNNRLPEPITLNRRQSGQWNYPWNNETAIWHFLNVTNREIKEVLTKNRDKLIVLFNDKDYEHNSTDNFIEVSGVDSMNFSLQTGNIIGYIQKGDYSLKISSRFGDKFLKYIISNADGFMEVDNYGGTNKSEGYEWLIIYLWKIKMKKAYRLGLPKSYISNKERLNKVRGNIDVLDYFSNRTLGKYQCNYREHSFNNHATKLISATFKKIGNHEFLNDCNLIRNGFYTATNGEKSNYRELTNTKHFLNPFYKDYNEVIDLSKLILKNELSDFGDNSENNAFFFDISMLFEYFIRKLIKRLGLLVESKFDERLEIATGNENFRRKLEPDIVFHHENKTFLFDVKYKSFDFRYGVSREDLFQLHTYVGQYGNKYDLKACGYIFPISSTNWERMVETGSCCDDSEISVMGKMLSFYVIFLKIPNDSDENFYSKFTNNCDLFLKTIEGIIEKN